MKNIKKLAASGLYKLVLGQIRIVQDVWFYCRYYQLCEDSLAPEMVAPLQKHWVESMCQYVPRKLVKNFPEATQDFVQVNNCSYGVWIFEPCADF